jgi:hypothetical protein
MSTKRKEVHGTKDHRVGPSPIFQSVAVDLFGPIEYQGVIKKEASRKGMGQDVSHIQRTAS